MSTKIGFSMFFAFPMYERIKKQCNEDGQSMATLIRKAVAKYLDEKDRESQSTSQEVPVEGIIEYAA